MGAASRGIAYVSICTLVLYLPNTGPAVSFYEGGASRYSICVNLNFYSCPSLAQYWRVGVILRAASQGTVYVPISTLVLYLPNTGPVVSF